MPRGLIIAFSMALTTTLTAQTIDQKTSDAWLISRMAGKYHVSPRPLDKEMSAAIYSQLLDGLDGQRLIFLADDIRQLSAYRLSLDEEILNRRTAFLTLVAGLFKQRLTQTDSLIDGIAAKPFDFTLHETFTVAEDTSWATSRQALRSKITRLLKYSVGYTIAYDLLNNTHLTPKSRDSLEIVLRKKAAARMHRAIRRILQNPQGIDGIVGDVFCQSLASCYDPHTDYFTPEIKAEFESELGNKSLSFGLTLTEDENGNPEIGKILAGGPAFQSGNLHEGDKILTVRWGDKEPIDVSAASLEETQTILADEGGTRVTLTVKKPDGTTRDVTLEKQLVNDGNDEDRVNGFVLNGARTVGYISLPAFYTDWEEDSRGVNGCANDVAKEILRLKRSNISGLILDLRYNGGGSMEEAVELAGIFIDAGPVAQVKTRDAKVVTLKDVNRGTVYDGPLILLVNGSSASASEMVAGTLQDYNRALIVGSPTFGKATVQVILPMDTTLDLANYNGHSQALNYLKVTISKLYRITGNTAQRNGVQPDILLPDPPDAVTRREADEKFALPATPIDANKYYKPLPPLPVAAARAVANTAMESSAYFTEARRHPASGQHPDKDISLFLDDIIAELKKSAAEAKPATTDPAKPTPLFTIGSPASEDRKKEMLNDPYLAIAYQLIAPLSN
ncbi:MAG TPA: S41 family peptidase [Puia sp.]|jgi:carboxyl-terminal processing protease|nr:S41 family peptidase [Puia sp.]